MKTMVLNFNYKGFNHRFKFKPDNGDYWTSFESHGIVFDIHYCDDYGHIWVYEVINGEIQTNKNVYLKKIR